MLMRNCVRENISNFETYNSLFTTDPDTEGLAVMVVNELTEQTDPHLKKTKTTSTVLAS